MDKIVAIRLAPSEVMKLDALVEAEIGDYWNRPSRSSVLRRLLREAPEPTPPEA